MARRTFDLDVSGTVRVVIDTEARSDWKPEQGILDTVADPERFEPGSTRETLLLALAQTIVLNGGRVGGSDGWADFPDGCVQAHDDYTSWRVEGVHEVSEVSRG